jgi:hypothetical protein
MIASGVGQHQPADLSELYVDTKSAAQEYLAQIARRITGEIHAEVFTGPPVHILTALVDDGRSPTTSWQVMGGPLWHSSS